MPKRHEMILNAIVNLARESKFVKLNDIINHFYKNPIFGEFWNIYLTPSNEAKSGEITDDVSYLNARGYVFINSDGKILLTQRALNFLTGTAQ